MDIHRVKPLLDRLIQTNDKWNFDLEDCDHILRVETWSTSASNIIDALENAGYRCEELEDLLPMRLTSIHSIESGHRQLENAMCKN